MQRPTLFLLLSSLVAVACATSAGEGPSNSDPSPDPGTTLPPSEAGSGSSGSGGPVDGGSKADGAPDGALPPGSGGAQTKLATLPSSAPGSCRVGSDGTNLFVLQANASGALVRLPLGGGAPTTLASGLAWAASLLVDGSDIYFSANDGGSVAIFKVPAAGGSAQKVLGPYTSVWSFAKDAQYIYFAEGGTAGGIWRWNRVDAPTQLMTGLKEVYNLKVLADRILFSNLAKANGDGAYALPLAGGAPTLLGRGFMTTSIDATATDVYFGTFGTYGANYQDGRIWRAPLAGGNPSAPTMLLDGQGFISQTMVVGGGYIYWGAGSSDSNAHDGQVRRVAVTGGAITTLGSATYAQSLLVDATHVYWCGAEGAVYRTLK